MLYAQFGPLQQRGKTLPGQPVISRTRFTVSEHILNASFTRELDKPDVLTIMLPSTFGRFIPVGDNVTLWTADPYDDSAECVGYFRINQKEYSFNQDTGRNVKVTCGPTVIYELMNTACPSRWFLSELKPADFLAKTVARVLNDRNVTVVINQLTALPVDVPALTADSANNMLDALNYFCETTGLHWRCRTDLLEPTIEIGTFGSQQPLTLIELNNASSRNLNWHDLNSRGFFRMTEYKTVENDDGIYDSLYFEGGMFTGPKERPEQESEKQLLLTTSGEFAEWDARFSVYVNPTEGGVRTDRLTALKSAGGVPKHPRRTQRLVAGSIAPEGSGGEPPTATKVADAARALLATCISYFDQTENGTQTIECTVQDSITHLFLAGDKLSLVMSAETDPPPVNIDGGSTYAEEWFRLLSSLYAIRAQTTWGSGLQIACRIELSSVLQSLVEPLSRRYEDASLTGRSTTPVYVLQYEAQVLCSPVGVYEFPTAYAIEPTVTIVHAPVGCTAFILSVTKTKVTVQIGTCVPPQSVTIRITPVR